jgi:hypothetical protein
MKTVTLALISFLVLCQTAVLAADADSIWVGNMQIGIGMEKSKVLSTLGEGYDVSKDNIKSEDPTWENWSIYKKSERRKPEDLVGMLAFQRSKVAWIGKPWGSFGGNEVAAFGKAFAGVVSGLIEKGKATATVRVRQFREPGVSMETIYLFFGSHDIALTFTDQGVQIQENLSK